MAGAGQDEPVRVAAEARQCPAMGLPHLLRAHAVLHPQDRLTAWHLRQGEAHRADIPRVREDLHQLRLSRQWWRLDIRCCGRLHTLPVPRHGGWFQGLQTVRNRRQD